RRLPGPQAPGRLVAVPAAARGHHGRPGGLRLRLGGAAMSWATAEQASEITGKTVTEEDLAVAQPVIDIFSGVVEEQADRLKAKDLRMLRYAVSYQAVWMKGNAGALTGSDVQSATQDSVSFTRFDEGNDDATVLAPLARR